MNTLLKMCWCIALCIVAGCTKDKKEQVGGCAFIGAKVWGGEPCTTELRNPTVLIFALAKSGGNTRAISVCSGALISDVHVLTAGHCIKNIQDESAKRGVEFAGWVTYVGGKGGEEIQVVEAKAHPRFSGLASDPSDIGVLTLARTPRPAVAPLSLLLSQDVEEGTRVTAYGYGKGENDERDIGALKALDLKVSGFYRENVFVEGDGKSSICQGDSGGPVVAQGPNGKPSIVAVSSFGEATGCMTTAAKAYGFASVQRTANLNFITSIVPDVAVE